MNPSHWALDPSLVYVLVAGGLYTLGSRGRGRATPLQAAALVGSLLSSP